MYLYGEQVVHDDISFRDLANSQLYEESITFRESQSHIKASTETANSYPMEPVPPIPEQLIQQATRAKRPFSTILPPITEEIVMSPTHDVITPLHKDTNYKSYLSKPERSSTLVSDAQHLRQKPISSVSMLGEFLEPPLLRIKNSVLPLVRSSPWGSRIKNLPGLPQPAWEYKIGIIGDTGDPCVRFMSDSLLGVVRPDLTRRYIQDAFLNHHSEYYDPTKEGRFQLNPS